MVRSDWRLGDWIIHVGTSTSWRANCLFNGESGSERRRGTFCQHDEASSYFGTQVTASLLSALQKSLDYSSLSKNLADEISWLNPIDFLLWGLMKETTCRTKVHTRDELLHQIMNVAAYIREHLEMIQPEVRGLFVWNTQGCAFKTAQNILKSYNINLVKCINKFVWFILPFISSCANLETALAPQRL
jgi:hypothetical protein